MLSASYKRNYVVNVKLSFIQGLTANTAQTHSTFEYSTTLH